ncbi:MAG: elongation factor G [Anaerolineae bacterium]|nr:elongation factor G [Anaerolineae bacterium]
MAAYGSEQLRNVVLLGHGSAGKTSLVEAMAFNAGVTNRLGRVEEGTAIADFDEEEVRRHISVSVAVVPCPWKDVKINVLDTPGYLEFIGEVLSGLRVAEAALLVLDAAAGVEVGTELLWRYADERSVPRLVVINKMDRENASFQSSLDSLSNAFDARFIPVHLPIGQESSFSGVVDLLEMKAIIGPEGKVEDIPSDMRDAVEEARLQVVEAAAEGDDELLMKYLEGEELTTKEIVRGLRQAVRSGSAIPVVAAAATANLAVRPLLDAIRDLLPSPVESGPYKATNPATGDTVELESDPAGPLAAFVFKTTADPYVGKLTYLRVYSGTLVSDSRPINSRTGQEERVGQLFFVTGREQSPTEQLIAGDIGSVSKLAEIHTGDTLCDRGTPLALPSLERPNPVYSVAVNAKSQADFDKMSSSMSRLVEEDPTLRLEREPSTGELILSGMGEAHLDVAIRRLRQKFGVEVITSTPRVPYRETITKTAQAQGRFKRQTGGRGQFGDVWLRLEPMERGSGFQFADEIFGGAVPRNFIPAVEKGVVEAMQEGILAGYPVVDVKVALYDGSYHPVDSSDMAFKLAASLGFRKAAENAGPILLEPIVRAVITVPEQFMGDVLGDLNSKRGRVLGMEQERGLSVVTALVPLAEMRRYATDLRAMTQGRGVFTMEFSHYDPVPSHVAEQVIAEAKREKEAEAG